MKRGFTIIEALMAIVFVGVVLVAALQAASVSAAAQYKAAERATARYLAQGMMADLLQKTYEDPNNTSTLGLNLSLGPIGVKINFGTIDNFNGWTESPPQDRDGNVIPGFTGWSRSVAIEKVNPANIAQISTTETGVKRITVTVRHNGVTITQLVSIRCKTS